MDKEETARADHQDAIMTLGEIARYLRVSDKTVLRMVQSGELPGGKVAGQWRFLRTLVDDWLSKRLKTADSESPVGIIRTKQQDLLPIPRLITRDRILLDILPGLPADVLRQLVQPLRQANMLPDPQAYLRALIEREEMMSTGIENGVAMPHARMPEQFSLRENCVVLGICPKGTDFLALDGGPTHLFVLIGSRTTAAHLRIMAKTVLMLRIPGIKDQFVSATTKDEITALVMKVHDDLSIRL